MRDLHDMENQPVAETSTRTQVLNLQPNLAATLAYAPFFIGLISSIIWVSTEPKSNRFVRFHAMQSLSLTVAGIAICVVASILGAILGPLGSLLSTLVSLALLGACVVCMIQAWNKNMFKLPVLGDFVESRL
jgi:uncharacterized membrane protein